MSKLSRLMCGSIAISLATLSAAAAGTPATVSIDSDGPHPGVVTIALDDAVSFTNEDSIAHRVSSEPRGFFSTGQLDPAETSRAISFLSSGKFAYEVLPESGEHGVVRIPVRLRPGASASPTPGAVIRIRVATERRHGRTYDVQRQRDDGPWVTIAGDVRRIVIRFRPHRAGTFSFRARLEIERLGITSGWSPPADKLVVPPP